MKGSEIREKFIAYFRDKRGHKHLPSASLIPDNPTLLLTSAGMVPFVPIFLGLAPPQWGTRVVTVQKCARAGGKDSDIENIGRTARHHSFFEMLGNFSFGDYFKEEVIPWAWEFVTSELGLKPEHLYVTVFAGDQVNPPDQEAYDIWHKKVGLPSERIFKMPREDNFWGPPGPTGPCGPCSEIYYDRGPEYGCSEDPEKCGIGRCQCDRYLEFWNLVFMELFKDDTGKFTPLARKNVDTGAGLERIATILQKTNNNYETDLLFPILKQASKLAGVEYGAGSSKHGKASRTDEYLKIITDHARCVVFLVADGVRVSNIGRGYVLRFIIRRAARFGRLLGLSEPFIHKLVPQVVDTYGSYYQELAENSEMVASIIQQEEDRFARTIDRGMNLLDQLLLAAGHEISGKDAFHLYATYGFPLELTVEIAAEHGKTVELESFQAARREHEEISAVNKFNVIITGEEVLGRVLKEHGQTRFTGYDSTGGTSQVIALLQEGKPIDHLEEGGEADIILDQTPFYAESGGQVGDTGLLRNTDATIAVTDTKKHEGLHIHKVKALAGILEPSSLVETLVDEERRKATVVHHSTAHLFHAAVRDLLGKHVVQAGSQVGPETMRFDFTFERQPKPDELAKVEDLMNRWVRLNLPVVTTEMSLEAAKRTGAIAMFGEKYGDRVRVVRMGDISLEFCGGTHVSSTSEIGPIKIVTEGSIASGVRRVEALSGSRAWQYINQHLNILSSAAGRLKIRPQDLLNQIDRLQEELKDKERWSRELEDKLALARLPGLLQQAEVVGDIRLILKVVPDISADGLRVLAEGLRRSGDNLVTVLGTALGPDRVSLAAGVSDALVKQGFSAGNLVKEAATICGGTGGGRPQLAAAGGKDPSKLEASMSHLRVSIAAAVNANV